MYLECILMCILYVFGALPLGVEDSDRCSTRPTERRGGGALCSVDRTRTRRSTHTANSTTETRTDVNACKDAIILCVFTPAITITAHHHRGRTGHRPRSPHCGHARARPGLYEYVVTLFDFAPRSPRPGRTKVANRDHGPSRLDIPGSVRLVRVRFNGFATSLARFAYEHSLAQPRRVGGSRRCQRGC